MGALDVLPSTDAVIVTTPNSFPVITPAGDIVARFTFDDVHITVRPVNTRPAASVTRAVACVGALKTIVVAGNETVTAAAGALVTVTVAVAGVPETVAVIVVVPAATPVTVAVMPFAVTLATVPDDVDHAGVKVPQFVCAIVTVNVASSPTTSAFVPGASVTADTMQAGGPDASFEHASIANRNTAQQPRAMRWFMGPPYCIEGVQSCSEDR
jgi:hypothetical protein